MKATRFVLLALFGAASAQADTRASANYSILAEIADRGGQRTGSANYTQDGSAGLISGTSSGATGVVLRSGYVAQLDSVALEVLSVVSRKVHGAGTFDINLPLTGLPGIECRTGGPRGNHQVVVTFAGPVTIGGVSVTSRDGLASAIGSVNGAVVTLDLTAVANAQTLGIMLSDVSNGAVTGNVTIPMGVLLGDVTGPGGVANGSVSNTDVSAVKSQVSAQLSASNFRTDVTVNGVVSNTDVSTTKAQVSTSLP